MTYTVWTRTPCFKGVECIQDFICMSFKAKHGMNGILGYNADNGCKRYQASSIEFGGITISFQLVSFTSCRLIVRIRLLNSFLLFNNFKKDIVLDLKCVATFCLYL